MTIAFWCVLIAALLPYIFTVTAKLGGRRYDNRSPRLFLEQQTGLQQRAHWTQLNSFEAFPPFAAGVIIAHIAEAEQSQIDLLASLFIAARVAYGAAYLSDKATLRSLLWMLGLGTTVSLFVISA
ncbi:membrane protein [Bacterioplanes sanyensis]|uniref:MAPEG family protein n=1 Tax=Bacterioplanes sanyensis TaxID=1249553 RepID=UPI00167BAF0A|nr:MAPEG family protein [Bacterioplanes sanyensis]GGY39797.1 membrane protein [Bacterioplanes sanyensis]